MEEVGSQAIGKTSSIQKESWRHFKVFEMALGPALKSKRSEVIWPRLMLV